LEIFGYFVTLMLLSLTIGHTFFAAHRMQKTQHFLAKIASIFALITIIGKRKNG